MIKNKVIIFKGFLLKISHESKLALYVHDFKIEIGHSNSLIELIRHMPPEYLQQFSQIEVVSFSTTPLIELFPNFPGKLVWTKVPFPKLRPVILKSIFYQVWVVFYNRLFQKGDVTRLGIGISSLDVHAVSIQFIHHQWTGRGLELESGFRLLYKKILFGYFEICERYLFSKKNIYFFSPASFLTKFLKDRFPGIKANTIYSGVNLNRFELKSQSKKTVLADLVQRYPILKELNIEAPIYLFVGAYERKGLHEALEILKSRPGSQFIVIGSPSLGKTLNWPDRKSVV